MSHFSNNKITTLQAYILYLAVAGSMLSFISVHLLLNMSKRDAFASSVIGSLLFLIYSFWLFRLLKSQRSGRSFIMDLEQSLGRLIVKGIKIWIAIFLLIEMFLINYHETTLVKSMVISYTPEWAIALPFLFTCAYLAVKGIKPIAIFASILFPAIIVFYLLQSLFTAKIAHYSLLLPLFSEGIFSILEGAALIFSNMAHLFILMLITNHTQGSFRWKPFGAIILLTIFSVINATVSLITTFGAFEASQQRFPIYSLWRLVRISSYVEHMDFLILFQNLSSTIVTIALDLFLVSNILEFKNLYKKIVVIIVTIFLIATVMIHLNDQDIILVTKRYFFPFSALSILCWTALAQFAVSKRGGIRRSSKMQ